MIKTIIFDWGGVLATSDVREAIKILNQNYEVDETEFLRFFKIHEDEHCDTNEFESLLDKASKQFNIPKNKLIEALNSSPLLETYNHAKELSKNYKIYLLSNQLKFRTDFIRNTYDLSFFKEVFFSNEIGYKKPHKDIFQFLLNEIKENPGDCLFVDDLKANIDTAKSLNINTILFENYEQFKDELKIYDIL